MNIALWVVAAILAAAFLAAGVMKLVTPRAQLADKMPWTRDASDAQVKLVGGLEVAGALGLILPGALNILPILVPLAALGLALTMVGAVVVHVRLKDPLPAMIPAIVVGLLCLFVAWGRFGPYAF